MGPTYPESPEQNIVFQRTLRDESQEDDPVMMDHEDVNERDGIWLGT